MEMTISGAAMSDLRTELELSERRVIALKQEINALRRENADLKKTNRGYLERHMRAYEGYLRGNAADEERHPFRVALMIALPFVGVAAGTVIALACVMR